DPNRRRTRDDVIVRQDPAGRRQHHSRALGPRVLEAKIRVDDDDARADRGCALARRCDSRTAGDRGERDEEDDEGSGLPDQHVQIASARPSRNLRHAYGFTTDKGLGSSADTLRDVAQLLVTWYLGEMRAADRP